MTWLYINVVAGPASYDLTLQWSWAASHNKEADRKSYLALGVTAVKKSDPTVTCAVVSSNYMLSTIQITGHHHHKGEF